MNEKQFGFWLDFIQRWVLDPRLEPVQAARPLRKYAEKGYSLRAFYEAFASLMELSLPSGEFDEDYGRNNLPYLVDSYWYEDDWEYRLYVPFSGNADVKPMGHCVSSWRFTGGEIDTSERFDSMEDTTSPREERLRLKFKGKRRTAPQVAA